MCPRKITQQRSVSLKETGNQVWQNRDAQVRHQSNETTKQTSSKRRRGSREFCANVDLPRTSAPQRTAHTTIESRLRGDSRRRSTKRGLEPGTHCTESTANCLRRLIKKQIRVSRRARCNHVTLNSANQVSIIWLF